MIPVRVALRAAHSIRVYLSPHSNWGLAAPFTYRGLLISLWTSFKSCWHPCELAFEVQNPFTIMGQPHARRRTSTVPYLSQGSIPADHPYAGRCPGLRVNSGRGELVFVQPSIYGTDNSCLLAALAKIGPSRGRGIVVVDPDTIQQETLDEWHDLGVRGLRVNLQSVGKVMDQSELERTLLRHAEIARPRSWIIELYLPLAMVPMLRSIVSSLGVTMCIDHFGCPGLSSISWTEHSAPFNPHSLPGFQSLIYVLRQGNTYIKVSAPYHLTQDRHMRDLKAMAREFLTAAPDRVIYATDCPHTRFTGVDISPFTARFLELCGHEPELAEKLFRRNTERMLDVQSDS